MRSYSLTEARKQQGQILEQAAIEPVLLTKRSRPSHVIMSADTYQQLIERLTQLEDRILGQSAEAALNKSQMVGTETFLENLKHLAN